MEWNILPWQGIALLLLIGSLLIAAEVFVPGMILGLAGAFAILGAIAWTYSAYGAEAGTIMLTAVGLIGSLAFFLYLKLFPKTFIGRQVINSTSVPNVTQNLPTELLGKTGEALTDLRPSGAARIEGRKMDVVAEGAFIEAHRPVQVVRVEKNYLVVRPVLISPEAR